MTNLEIGVVSDEISRDLDESLDYCRQWSITRIELREGSKHRFPRFTDSEWSSLEAAVAEGFSVTAVSPGIFKASVDDERTIRNELENVLPASIDAALKLGSRMVITFGFERYAGESSENRARAMKILEQAADRAWAESLVIAVENEPNFWIDQAVEEAALLEEIDHPGLKANWDPANSHWGGKSPDRADFDALRPHIANLHVKDFTLSDPEVPWRPVGQGETPWHDYLKWTAFETDLKHITIETHAEPLIRNTRQSLAGVRTILERLKIEEG